MAHIQRKCRTCRRSVAEGERSCRVCGSRNVAYIARYGGPDRRERTKSFDRKADAESYLTTQESAKRTGE